MLAVFSPSDATGADALLAGVADRLQAARVPVAGCLQETRPTSSGQPERWLRFLDGSATLAITQDLGAGSVGCSLDPAALALAAGRIAPRIDGARVLILNRFGRSEATGGGFRPLIAAALEAEVPVLTVVPDRYRAAFNDFAGGMETWLAPDALALGGWLVAQGLLPAFAAPGGIVA